MKMTFGELVDELHGRPSEELSELADLAHRYAIEQQRTEMTANAAEGLAAYERGQLKFYDNVEELMRSLDEES